MFFVQVMTFLVLLIHLDLILLNLRASFFFLFGFVGVLLSLILSLLLVSTLDTDRCGYDFILLGMFALLRGIVTLNFFPF